MNVTAEYVDGLAPIYRDILKSYVIFNSQRTLGSGVALQSLYAALYDKYTPSQIRVACERMQKGGVLTIEDDRWTFPTEVGEELIDRLTEGERPEDDVPPFTPPPSSTKR